MRSIPSQDPFDPGYRRLRYCRYADDWLLGFAGPKHEAEDIKSKIALFCNVEEEAVITAKDVASIYEVPLVLAAEGLDRIVLKYLHLPQTERHMRQWEELVDRIKNPSDEITIHVVGKYVGYEDSYKSLNEALYHGGFENRVKVNIKWIEAEALEDPIGALARLELARVLTMSGDARTARAVYQDLLALWKDADPDLAKIARTLHFDRRLPLERRVGTVGRRSRMGTGDVVIIFATMVCAVSPANGGSPASIS